MLTTQLHFFLLFWILYNVGGHVLKRSSEIVDNELDGNEIHCYCNLPSCITSSYMCKTKKMDSGCFKRFDLIAQQYHYGCLDSSTKQKICFKTLEIEVESPDNETSNAHQCCFTDMCNHESNEISSSILSPTNLNLNESEDDLKEMLLSKKNRSSTFIWYTNSEIWFRAVLIAVPICGLMILLILIFIAVRLLQSDVADDGISSSKLIKGKPDIVAVSSTKLWPTDLPEAHDCNLGSSLKTNKYSSFKDSFPFVFRQDSQNLNKSHSSMKSTKYHFMSKPKYNFDSQAINVHHFPKVSEKLSLQHLNILKLPAMLNELKQKSLKNHNINDHVPANNAPITCNINDNNSVTNVNSHPNFKSCYTKK